MSNRSGSHYSVPRDANHVPFLVAASTADGITPVVLEADPSTHLLQVSSSGGGGGTSSSFNAAFPSTGTAAGASDGTNMKPLLVDASGYLEVNVKAGSGSGLSVTDGATWTAGSSQFVPAGGVFNDSATALTSGQEGTLRLTANRSLHTTTDNGALESGGNLATLAGTVASSKVNVNISSGNITNFALETGGNLATVATNTTGLNSTVGTTGSAVQSKGLLVQGSDGTDARNLSTDSSGRPNVNINGTVPVSGTFWQTTQPVSLAVNTPTLQTGSNIIGKVGIDQTTNGTTNAVVTVPATSGGLSTYSGSITTTVTSVKGSAGQIYGYHLYNPNAAVSYVQLFDLATGSVTLGTTTPKLSLTLPANSGATINLPQGIQFATAISVACTTTRTGNTAPGSSVDLNFYID